MTTTTIKRTAGGTYDPEDRHLFFLASNTERHYHAEAATQYVLVAVNELAGERSREHFEGWLDQGKAVLLDSGIFTLAMDHARAHNMPLHEALTMPPDRVDGFDELFALYVDIIETHGDRLWGYVELDLGSSNIKARTRAGLEKRGMRPIPVYHPLGDDYEYFDELAQNYDRICIGNLVQAAPPERLRILATIHHRKQAYPHLWVHALGATPNPHLYACPPDSADSSSWLSAVRWSGQTERACGLPMGPLDRGFQYVQGSDPAGPDGSRRATLLSAYAEQMHLQNWRAFTRAYGED